jgi:hypothetical protein
MYYALPTRKKKRVTLFLSRTDKTRGEQKANPSSFLTYLIVYIFLVLLLDDNYTTYEEGLRTRVGYLGIVIGMYEQQC